MYRVVARAAGHGFAQRVARHAGNRRCVDKTQRVAQRPLESGADIQRRRMHQVGYACIGLDQLQARQAKYLRRRAIDLQRRPMKNQLAIDIAQCWPGHGIFGLNQLGHIGKGAVFDNGRYFEFAFGRV